MSEAFNQRPPQRRYIFIWDKETALVYLSSQPEAQCLSDKVLILKRASGLTNLMINCLVKSKTCYIIHLSKLSITWCKHRPKPQNLMFFRV